MTPDEYQQAALRTEYTPDFVRPKPFENDAHSSTALLEAHGLARLLHGMIGVCTEAGELQDMVKKHLIYGKPFDPVNVIEECGDLLWYIALCLDACGFKMSDAMTRNIDKLRKRFPDKFTSEHAINRDLDAEHKALESGRLVVDPADDSKSARANVEITDLDPHRDADHALEALRRITNQLGFDLPIKLRDSSNKRIAELCCTEIDMMRADLAALRRARDAFILATS